MPDLGATAARVEYAAIILAGGRASRLGGHSKAALKVNGRPLLATVLDAVREARPRVVVGDGPVPPGVVLTRETPRYAGPAAAVVAGLRSVVDHGDAPPWTMLLACDLPGVSRGVARLVSAAGHTTADSRDGWCLVDEAGRRQWLFSLIRTESLHVAARDLADPVGAALGQLLGTLDLAQLPAPPNVTADIDTWEDFDRWSTS